MFFFSFLHDECVKSFYLKCMGTPHSSPPSLQRGKTFVASSIFPWKTNSFQNGSTLKGKNLLLLEQILSFKS